MCTENVIQELLHRSSANPWQNPTSHFLLFLSGGRDSQAVAYEMRPSAACRTPKSVAKCGFCLSSGNPVRRSRVSDGQTCVVVKCKSSLPPATVCGDRACRTPKHVVESWNAYFFWTRTTLCRDRVGQTSKHVAKCKFGEARRRPFARNEGQTSKTQNCDFLTSDAKVQELV